MANVRQKGHSYELKILKELEALGYDGLKTSRNESRTADAAGIDIVSTMISANPIPFAPQCKSYSCSPNYPKLFSTYTYPLPLVIFHKLTKKATTNFNTLGEYVIIEKSYFYKLLEQANNK